MKKLMNMRKMRQRENNGRDITGNRNEVVKHTHTHTHTLFLTFFKIE